MNLHHGMKASLPVQNAVWDKRFLWVKIFVIICADNGVWNGYKGVIMGKWSDQTSRINFTVVHRNAEFLKKKVDVRAKLLFTVFGKKHQNAASGGQILFHFVDLKTKEEILHSGKRKERRGKFSPQEDWIFPADWLWWRGERPSTVQPWCHLCFWKDPEKIENLIIWFHLFNL